MHLDAADFPAICVAWEFNFIDDYVYINASVSSSTHLSEQDEMQTYVYRRVTDILRRFDHVCERSRKAQKRVLAILSVSERVGMCGFISAPNYNMHRSLRHDTHSSWRANCW